MWLNTIPTTFLPESQMAWDTWEKFVANYEVFRNNILVELKKYKEGISLKEFYHGTIGKVSVLNIRVRLEKLELCEAKNQFPKTGLPINRLNNKIVNLDGLVIVNGHSAPFADVFLLRKTIPRKKNLADRNLLIAFQQKWYTTLQKFTIDDAVKECNKNKNAYKYVKDDKLREFLEGAHIVHRVIGCTNYLEDVRTQLESCSYAPFSFLDNEDDSMKLDEYESLNSNDNVIEMDVDNTINIRSIIKSFTNIFVKQKNRVSPDLTLLISLDSSPRCEAESASCASSNSQIICPRTLSAISFVPSSSYNHLRTQQIEALTT
ncbi:unnamed protein product [Rhizophagus irregularis]|nr:unnamed protein product [Rhizophagus irregularis]